MKQKRLNLEEVYRTEAQRIVDARRKFSTIHATGDIRASGEEVEKTVREVIAARLPLRYRTTHGHILDYNGRVSPQQDVIIAENLAAKSLFETSDGTEYVPYESVYAIGEIKSTYYKNQGYLQKFSQTLHNIRSNLTRQKHIQHRLLSFMFFVASNDFETSDVEAFYRKTPRDYLPTFVCFLDRGTIVYTKFLKNGLGQPVLPVQYYLRDDAPVDENHKWSLIQWGNNERREGPNMMFLHLSLVQHLQECGQAVPNLFPYFVSSIDWDKGEIFQ